MKKKLCSALLASALIPFAAVAQTTTPPPTTPPADGATTDPAAPDATTPPADGATETTPPVGETPTDTPDTETDTDTDADTDALDAPGDTPDATTDTPDATTPDTGATPGAGTGMDADTGTDTDTDVDADADGDTDADTTADTGSAIEGPFVTVPPTGAWRVSDLEGKNVEDAAGENIGSITDVLVDEEGEVIAVLVGVGGFLGIGRKDVAVAMDALEFGPTRTEGLSSAPPADAAPAGGMDPAAPPAGGMDAGAPAPAAPPVLGEDNLPDRIVLNVSREELENAPAYGEPEDAGGDAGMMGTDTGGGMGADPAAPPAPQ